MQERLRRYATAAFRLHSAGSGSAGRAAGCASLLPEPCRSHTARIWGTQRPYQQYSCCIVGFSCVAPVGAQHQLPQRVHPLAHFRQLLLPASAAAAATRGGGGGCAGSSHGRVRPGACEELGARSIQSSLLTGQRCLRITSTAVETRTAGTFLTNLLTNPLWGTACRWPRQGGAPLPRRASGVAFAPHSACRWTDRCSSAVNAAGRRPRPGGGLPPRRGSSSAVTAADISISA